MKFSVIIPTHNRRDVLAKTLAALTQQNFPKTQFEVLVIVDGSLDGTIEMLKEALYPFSIRYFYQTRKGPAAARNVGISNALGEIVLFLDDDTIPAANLLREHLQLRAEGNEKRIIRGPFILHHQSPPSSTLQNHRYEDATLWGQFAKGLSLPEDAVCDANTSVSLKLLRQVKGFDEAFLYQRETVELGYRLYLAGGEYVYNPRALTYHYYLKTEEDLIEDAYWRGRSDYLFLQKHPSYGGTAEVKRYFQSKRMERKILFLLWHVPFIGVFLNLVSRFLAPFFPPLNRTRGMLNRARRFCAYSKGMKEKGASWFTLAKQY